MFAQNVDIFFPQKEDKQSSIEKKQILNMRDILIYTMILKLSNT